MDVTETSPGEWDDLLPESGFDAFHTIEALEILDQYADGDLRLFAGFRGEQPVGLLPLFVREVGHLTIVVSPPPALSVSRLGPVVMPSSPKKRKREETNRQFTDAVLESIDVDDRLTAFGLVSTPQYTDPRPYLWNDLHVAPRFTYALDLGDRGTEDVLNAFTSDIRQDLRKRDDLDVEITVEGGNAAGRVCIDVKERHAEQGLRYETPPAFSEDLVDALGERSRVYVARAPDGTYLGGITMLYANDVAMSWQGGTKTNYRNVSVNDLINWRIIEDILEDPALDSIERYDMGNAAVERIASYKSKFDAEVLPHYEIKSDLMIVGKAGHSIRRHLTLSQLIDRVRNIRRRLPNSPN